MGQPAERFTARHEPCGSSLLCSLGTTSLATAPMRQQHVPSSFVPSTVTSKRARIMHTMAAHHGAGDVKPTMRALMEGPMISKTLQESMGHWVLLLFHHATARQLFVTYQGLTQAKSQRPGFLGCQRKRRGAVHLSSQHGMQAGMKCFQTRFQLRMRQATFHSTSAFCTSPRQQGHKISRSGAVLPRCCPHMMGSEPHSSRGALHCSCDHKITRCRVATQSGHC